MDTIELTYRFTGKEVDEETGLYYYGARYLDPRTSRWLSTDPALGEYIPVAPVNEEAKKANQNLPGMGGVFNVVNFQLYHYAGNNPVKYVDPDGRTNSFPDGSKEQNAAWDKAQAAMKGLNFGDPLKLMLITSTFGLRSDAVPFKHDGIDFRAPVGMPVYATEDGIVKEADLESSRSSSGSSYLIIDHGNGYETRSLHMDSFTVKAGDKVQKGQIVGYTGTRKNMQPHLHFEIRKNGVPKDPEIYILETPKLE